MLLTAFFSKTLPRIPSLLLQGGQQNQTIVPLVFSLLQSQMFRMHFAICIASTVLFLICKDSTLRSTRAYYNATGNAITMLLHATLAGSRDPVRDQTFYSGSIYIKRKNPTNAPVYYYCRHLDIAHSLVKFQEDIVNWKQTFSLSKMKIYKGRAQINRITSITLHSRFNIGLS